jgi:hypothetical protein
MRPGGLTNHEKSRKLEQPAALLLTYGPAGVQLLLLM